MEPFNAAFHAAAVRTLCTSRWTVLCARLFGRRVVGEDGDYRVVAYEWRGKLYLTDAGARI